MENDIPLLEIPYWDLNNINQILNEEILPLDLMKQEYPLIEAPVPDQEAMQLSFAF